MPSATLLTWNPARSDLPVDQWIQDVADVKRGVVPGCWSTANRYNIPVGERVLLLRQGKDPRGIIAAGRTVGVPEPGKHYSDPAKKAYYVKVEWDAMVRDYDDPLPIDTLEDKVEGVSWKNLMRSGTAVDEASAAKIERLWLNHRGVVRRRRFFCQR